MKKIVLVLMLILCTTLAYAQTYPIEHSYSPTIYNVTLTSADTEYSQALPRGTKKFTLQCRTSYDVRLAYVTGKVATPTAPYITVKSGNVYWEDNLNIQPPSHQTAITIYLASSQAGVVCELICWQ